VKETAGAQSDGIECTISDPSEAWRVARIGCATLPGISL